MIGRFANLFKGKDPNTMSMDELFARDQRMYGDSVPDGSFGINSKSTDFTPRHNVFSSPLKSGFSGSDALGAFKSLLDVSNAMEDENRKKSMNTFGNFGGLFSRSSGTGGMQLSSGPFGTTTYFPDTSSQGGGGQGGGGKEPSRMAKALGGASVGCQFGPWGCAVGAGLGFLS